jgi:hypothetical protein
MKRVIIVLVCASAPADANKGIFPRNRVRQWAHDLRPVANGLNNSDRELAGHFYNVHYAIGPDTDSSEYDPFALDEDYLALPELGGREGLVASLKVVLENGKKHVPAAIWEGGLENYLEQLLNHMTAIPFMPLGRR